MSDIKINELLSQIRSISKQIDPSVSIGKQNNEDINFASTLKTSIDKVNQQQMKA